MLGSPDSRKSSRETAALRDLEFSILTKLDREQDARQDTVKEVKSLLESDRAYRTQQLEEMCKRLLQGTTAAPSSGSHHPSTVDVQSKMLQEGLSALRSSLEKVLAQQGAHNQQLQQLQARQEQLLGDLVARQGAEPSPPTHTLPAAPAAPAARQEKLQPQEEKDSRTIAPPRQDRGSVVPEVVMASLQRLEARMEDLGRFDLGKLEARVAPLAKLESRLEELQRTIEEIPTSRSDHSNRSGPSKDSVGEGPFDFSGLWHEQKARHFITGKFIHSDGGSLKLELKVHSARNFSVEGNVKGLAHAMLSEDGQQLLWSSGRVWTRAQRVQGTIKRPAALGDSQEEIEDDETSDNLQRLRGPAPVAAPKPPPSPAASGATREGSGGLLGHFSRSGTSERPASPTGSSPTRGGSGKSFGGKSKGLSPDRPTKRGPASFLEREKAEEVRLAWLSQRGEMKTEDLAFVRSPVGLTIRAIATDNVHSATGSKMLERMADAADWFEVQKRSNAEEGRPPLRCIDRIVQNYAFECIAALLIMGNAVYIGYAANWYIQNPGRPSPDTMLYVDMSFFVAFTAELLLRMASLGKKFLFGPDAVWYIGDMVLLAISGAEIAAGGSGGYAWLRTLRAFKLARVIRMVRTISFFKDLRLMMDCMMGSLVSLLWCLVLVFFMLYLFSLIFVQGFADYVNELQTEVEEDPQGRVEVQGHEMSVHELLFFIQRRYGSVTKAMFRLWSSTTGGVDWNEEYYLIRLCGQYHSFVFLAFIAFMLIVVWNIVTSTIVEKALRYAQPDIDQLLMEKRRRDDTDVQMLCAMFEKNGIKLTHKITKDEFLALLQNRDLADFLQARGIDIKEAHTFFALIGEEEGVDPVSFILSCLRIKGFATSIDLHTTHHQLMKVLVDHQKALQTCQLTLQSMAGGQCGTRERLSSSEELSPLAPAAYSISMDSPSRRGSLDAPNPAQGGPPSRLDRGCTMGITV